MSTVVLAAVLGSAVLHGGWNAIAKFIPDRLVASMLIGAVYLVGGAVGVVLLPLPAAGAWPVLIASTVVQTGYLLLLTAAYAKSDFSQAYPLTRGLSVVGITVVSAVFLGQHLAPLQTAGVVVVALALLSLTWVGGRRMSRVGMLLAFAVGATITTYSVLDGVGVRLAGDALGYAAWVFFLQGVTLPATCLLIAPRKRALLRDVRSHAGLGIIAGILSLVAYTIVMWAQSLAPLAVVSALRESGVLAAGVIGLLVFKEPFSRWRLAATVIAVAGIIAVRLG